MGILDNITPQKKTYYYITASVQGRNFTDGPYPTEDEAREVAFRTLQGDFVIVESRAGSLKAFNQEHRHNVLVQTQDVPATFKNFKHTL
jgi:hypothetical protein